ncbi:MAG: septum formation protein Maf [Ignavibacteria bacterium]|nr:septum formation protein Maf [Ignavibacteria bacterium]
MINVNALLKLDKPLVLASASPRRRQLLEHIGLHHTTVTPNIDEDVVAVTLPPEQYVMQLALLKAIAGATIAGAATSGAATSVSATISEATLVADSIVLGSDTTVVLDGVVMNKPINAADAVRMLTALSGNTHTVYTGIALYHAASKKSVTAFSATRVTFRPLTQEEIAAYVATESPLDKAGAYGIQDDFGAVFVSHVEGCYYTIVGLPLQLLYTTLQQFAALLKGAE